MAEIKNAILGGNYRFSIHARRQMSDRRITLEEVEEAISSGEVIENYPEDKYRPSCLILGFTSSFRPLHIQCCKPIPEAVIVTCYEPDPGEWENFRIRLKR